ncbi:MAG: IS30 family transposase [Candidatus Scatosoma sp.]
MRNTKDTFRHLTFTARLQIEAGLKVKMPINQIAKQIGVHVSTVYREIKRGIYQKKTSYYDHYGYEKRYRYKETYSPDKAEQRYRNNLAAKGAPLKIGNDFDLANYIERKIAKEKQSPDSVIGEIRRKNLPFKTSICTTTLYSYIEKGVFATLSLRDLPEKGKKKKRKQRGVVVNRAPRGTSIERRPKTILKRNEFGHWEMDCVCGPTTAVFLVLTERMTRREIIMSMQNQRAENVIRCLNVLERKYGQLFRKVFKTITVDNGSEFSAFQEMERSSFGRGKGKRTQVFYCHPYCSSERGSNERMNREIRRRVPKGTDLSRFSEQQVKEIETWLNTYPRKVLNYATPQELFDEEIAKIS